MIEPISAGIMVGSTLLGFRARRKARRQELRAARAQDRINRLREQGEKTQAIREGRIQRGRVLAAGETAGVAGSSAVLGGAASAQSQLGSNLGFLGQVRREVDIFDAATASNLKAQNIANRWDTVAGLSQFAIQNSSTIKGFFG